MRRQPVEQGGGLGEAVALVVLDRLLEITVNVAADGMRSRVTYCAAERA
jgi:hypothetical protein